MSQLVGAAIQFSIGQLLVFKDHCDGGWSSLDLSFEQMMDALVLGIVGLRVIPLDQQLMSSPTR